MKFLIQIEEAINQIILKLLVKLKEKTPPFFFKLIAFLKELPNLTKNKFKQWQPKLQVWRLKFIGYTLHYLTLLWGHFTAIFIYLRSEEFKKADKYKLILKPLKYAIAHPGKSAAGTLSLIAILFATSLILKNTAKIAMGTYALRKPASFVEAEEDIYIEYKRQRFEIKLPAAPGENATESHTEELYLDVTIEAQNSNDKQYLETMGAMLTEILETQNLKVDQLPLTDETKKQLEDSVTFSINDEFKKIGRDTPVKAITLKQVLPGRPKYYRQTERLLSVEDINLQIFLEDTKRNRQVWIDFSILANNRNVIIYLKDHEVEFKDHLTTNVEPVIPQLPVEDEGRMIIKEKIKLELNEFLNKKKIEGKVLEIYIDYLISS